MKDYEVVVLATYRRVVRVAARSRLNAMGAAVAQAADDLRVDRPVGRPVFAVEQVEVAR